jgi:hypothetical protein
VTHGGAVWITKKLEEHSCVCDSARQREAEISAVVTVFMAILYLCLSQLFN